MAPTVLVIAYNFPPVGGPGTQRALGLVRQLPPNGFKTVVLTGPGPSSDFWSPPDADLVSEIPSEVDVVRIHGPEPRPSQGIRRRLERLAARPTAFREWFATAALSAVPRLPARPDVILAELVPYDVTEGVTLLASHLKCPWVADLLDPWALDEMWLYPTWFHRKLDERRMANLLASSTAVVMNTDEAARRVRSQIKLPPDVPVYAIPSGFDGRLFLGAAPAPHESTRFRIVHTGTMHLASGLDLRRKRRWRTLSGGMPVGGVDFVPRSHYYLLAAIERLLEEDPSLANTLELLLVGPVTDADKQVSERFSFVHLLGFRTYRDTVDLIRTADLLFLPMHALPDGTKAGLVPTKTYEYVASGRPILAAVPDGDARELLEAAGTAIVCHPTDVSAIAAALRSLIAAWRSGTPPPKGEPDVVRKYEYAQLAERLATLLRSAIGEERLRASPLPTD
jgi:glycosyltransferase involved in cell wall biosynthesis